MPFNLSFTGHATTEHRTEINAVFENAMTALQAIDGLEHLAGSGWVSDDTGTTFLTGGVTPSLSGFEVTPTSSQPLVTPEPSTGGPPPATP